MEGKEITNTKLERAWEKSGGKKRGLDIKKYMPRAGFWLGPSHMLPRTILTTICGIDIATHLYKIKLRLEVFKYLCRDGNGKAW